jgi:hypothetical protein
MGTPVFPLLTLLSGIAYSLPDPGLITELVKIA